MDDLRYKQAKQLFLEVCDLTPDEREKPLTRVGESDPKLRAEVESLLVEHDRAADDKTSEKRTVALGGPESRAPTVPASKPESRRPTVSTSVPESHRATMPSEAAQKKSSGRSSRSKRKQPDQVGPYRIIHELGRGGMGLVYLGERQTDQFRRRAAIKVLKKGMDTEDILRRFKLEEQLLGSLNHPGIARHYDAGETDEGLPYFAMEYIEGSDMEQYCDAHRLSVRERLVLFKKVCEAVHYAHQNLVVHRDLKPGNIIVTSDGQPKLLDFGIAKLLNPELGRVSGDPTAPEFRVMTPEYASPEQVRGNPITTASDIYSLGVMLYEMLSGHAPYEIKSRARPELERVICQQDPDRPSTAVSKVAETQWINPTTGTSKITPDSVSAAQESRPDRLRRSLAGDLDNIVLMAMRKEPQRRYASAEQMAEDIQRHLDGMPVIARPDTFRYRAVKFVGRNRAGVAAAAAIAVLLVGGITGTTSGWAAAEERRAEIEEAWMAVDAERERAEGHLDRVVAISSEMLGPLHQAIETLDGSLPARRQLVEISKGYLEALDAEVGENPDLRAELALANHRIADVYGGLRNPSEGELDTAYEHFSESLRMREELLAESGDDPDRKRLVSKSLLSIGDIERRRGDTAGALETYRRMLSLEEEINDARPDDASARRGLAIALSAVGDGLYLVGDKDGSLDRYQQSLPVRKKLMAEFPDKARYARDVSTISIRIGSMLRDRGDFEEAIVKTQDAVRIRKRLAESDPNSARYRRDYANARYYEGKLHFDLGDYDDAAESIGFFLAAAEQRTAAAPLDARAAMDLADAHQAMGRLYAVQCNLERALQHFDAFNTQAQLLQELAPDSTRYLAMYGESYQRLGEVMAAQGAHEAAIERGREALRLMDRLASLDENDMRSKESLAETGMHLGRWLTATGDLGEAMSRLRDARDLYRELHDQMPSERSVQAGLARTLAAYADVLLDRDEPVEALDAASEAVGLPPADPDRPAVMRTLARAHAANDERSTAAGIASEALELLDGSPHPDCDDVRGKLEADLRKYQDG